MTNANVMTEHRTNNPKVIQFRCCCGMEYLYAHGDPDNTVIKVHIEEGFDNKGGRVEMNGAKGLPMFGHLRDDCPGAGAPLVCHGTYEWDGFTWGTVIKARKQ